MVIGFIFGLLSSILFASLFYLGFIFGRDYKPREKKETAEEKEIKKVKEKELMLRQQGLNNILDYDIDVAMGRREQK